MNARENLGTIQDKKLLSWTEGAIYTGLGKTTFRKWAESINAVVKMGTRVLFDRDVIDTELNKLRMNRGVTNEH